jgi:putative FmdB family regulatory protein
MPIYTYRCTNCGVQFEQQQKFDEQPLTRCPECSKKTLRKIYQPVGIVFKGTGFYATDHRSPSGAGRASSSKSGEESKSSEAKESGSAGSPPKDTSSGKDTGSNKE